MLVARTMDLLFKQGLCTLVVTAIARSCLWAANLAAIRLDQLVHPDAKWLGKPVILTLC
jgi:hypothetical protein